MNFLKSIWNKVKSFFGNLFGSKKVAAIAAPAAVAAPVANEVEVAAQVETAVAVEVAANDEAAVQARLEHLAAIFERIVEAAAGRNYPLDEARMAFHSDDEATLVRIERQMKSRSYKSPSKKTIAKLAKAAV